jgi:IclR family acetate operon transcriptional repressor
MKYAAQTPASREELSGTKCIDAALALLKESLTSRSDQCVSDIAGALGLPIPTTYRHLAALRRHGLIRRGRRQPFAPGVFLLSLLDRVRLGALIAEVARPIVLRLATELRATSHLGVLENEMVTYLVKAQPEEYGLFSKENFQLEAYCSGLGKVLLAWLPDAELNAYLGAGEFVSLTRNTIVDEALLRAELMQVKQQGFAIDNEEFERDLFCVAVPLRESDGRIMAAISVSGRSPDIVGKDHPEIVHTLVTAADQIRDELYRI